MATLRVIGDVHGQIDLENLCTRRGQPYLDIIAGVPFSVQIGDMGDGETYDQLIQSTDPSCHRFFPGNHDHYDQLPPHSLGDFGAASLGGVEFFFVRGAASKDRDKLIRLGQQLGKTLWFEQEELSEDQMRAVEQEYRKCRPQIMLSHDAPTPIAQLAWNHARRVSWPDPEAVFRPSRTNDLLSRLLDHHQPRLWVFGHHHHAWQCREGITRFVCVGELSKIDIDSEGALRDPSDGSGR